MIIKVIFSAATIALAAGVLASRTLAGRAKVAILLFMLALLIANADFYWIYHARVTYALSVKLFATGLLVMTLVYAGCAATWRNQPAQANRPACRADNASCPSLLLQMHLETYSTRFQNALSESARQCPI